MTLVLYAFAPPSMVSAAPVTNRPRTGMEVMLQDQTDSRKILQFAADELSDATDPRLIAALRLVARSYRAQSVEAADDLVELTLRTAIQEVEGRPEEISLFNWLSAIMARYRK
ncbi:MULTISPECIES: hypothetical protein [Mesorhizobium]|uniref:hypothetical protein n=1 Tax=Mesorhizobium TaxID=68287 RepID=UPI0012F624AB|nr:MULTISPECIES: hypothetical protein [Mesorhizobium]MBZ9683664.1 hypothetical protein [Mesorhizobium sp. CO1-1-2]MBZ9696545.1 hypothetical protein [Mesorhizobium sp. CO1-1-9]MBZ9725464.1 hypothetical protein [Mesorhizobium sp. CO1-1-11]MBZ9923601.1 hypothetical protein [Mesorhizobium sp. BR1-1-4]